MKWASIVIVVVLSGCVEVVPEVDCVPEEVHLNSEEIVSAHGGQFWLGEAPFVFKGTNLYYAMEASRRGQLDQVEAVFDGAVEMGMSVVRIWAFNTDPSSSEIVHRGPGDIDEEGLRALDRVLVAAEQRGLRLILTLTNNWADYGGLDAYGAWAGLDDRASILASEAVRGWLIEYARALALRVNSVTGEPYRDSRTIFGWEIINEPRCPGCAPSLMRDFLVEIAEELREADPNHLIGVGDEGYQGEEGVDVRLHASSGVFDWVSVHVWPHDWYGLGDSRGSQRWGEARAAQYGRDWIAAGAEVARQHGLPLVVGEFGWPAEAGTEIERAAVVGAWLDEASRQGAGGALIWMLVDPGRPDYDGYALPVGHSPVMEAMLCGFEL